MRGRHELSSAPLSLGFLFVVPSTNAASHNKPSFSLPSFPSYKDFNLAFKPTRIPQTFTMATEPQTPVVDETPISPIRSSERRNSLEKHLQHRPEAQDLKNRHILLDSTAAP